MVKKNHHPIKKRKSIWERLDGWWLWIFFLCLALLRGLQTEITLHQLADRGIQTKGFIYGKTRYSSLYRFYYPSWEYERHGRGIGRIGDSIDVIFLPDKPEKNHSWYAVKDKRKAKERIASGELHP